MKKISHKGVSVKKPENVSMSFIKFLIDNADGHYGNLQPIIDKVSNMLAAKNATIRNLIIHSSEIDL